MNNPEMPYPNEHAARLQDPKKFDRSTFRRTKGGKLYGRVQVPESIGIIWGKYKGKTKADDPVIAQSLRFDKKKWTVEEAKKWLKDNKIKYISFEPAKSEGGSMGNQSWYSIKFEGEEKKIANVDIFDSIGGFGIQAKQFIDELKAQEFDLLNLTINSPGGSVIEGNAIFNYLNSLTKNGKEINVEITGMAASMASIIAMTGTHVAIHENSYLMIHNPFVGVMGDSEELKKMADLLDKMKEDAITAYQKHTDLSREEIAKMMDKETWMNGKEAVEKGFADEMLPIIEAAAKVKFDFSKTDFKNIPEELKNAIKTEQDTNESKNEGSEPQESEESADEQADGTDERVKQAEALIKLQEEVNNYKSQVDELKMSIEKRDELIKKLQSEKDKLNDSLMELQVRFDKLLDGGLKFEAEPETWKEALEACGGDYVKARKQFKHLFEKQFKIK